MINTTNNLEEFNVWKRGQMGKRSWQTKRLMCHIGVWVYLCENKSFGYLMSIIHKTMINPYTEYKIGTYLPWLEKKISGHNKIVENPLLFFVILFITNVREDVQKALGNNQGGSFLGWYH
jgi:hypothetical protein